MQKLEYAIIRYVLPSKCANEHSIDKKLYAPMLSKREFTVSFCGEKLTYR